MNLGPIEIVFAVIGLSILVIVHESGHYLAARAFGMRVLTYSIGFGPTIFKYQPKDSPTVFKVGAFPFLAYVYIAGMNPHEDIDPQDPELFPNKGLFARIVTIAAGPVANYLTASLFVFILGIAGWPQGWLRVLTPDDTRAQPQLHEPMLIDSVEPDTAAAAAGLQAGDVITEVAGHRIRHVGDLREQLEPNADTALPIVFERDGETHTATATPGRSDSGKGILGVRAFSPAVAVQFGVGEAATTAITFPWRITLLQFKAIGSMIRRATTDGIGGPVKMAEMIGSSAKSGPLSFLAVLVFLSVALGMFNLLPLPALDGGRLTFLGYEAITRRKPNEKLEAIVHTVGIVFLLGVIVLVTIRDIREFGEPPGQQEEASTQTSEEEPGSSSMVAESSMTASPAAAAPSTGSPSSGSTPTTGERSMAPAAAGSP